MPETVYSPDPRRLPLSVAASRNYGGAVTGGSAGVNAQTGTTYLLQNSDDGKIVTLNNASPITVTVPINLNTGFVCTFVQLGAGQVTFAASGTTLNSFGSLVSMGGQFAVASLINTSANVFVLTGNLT